jgi:hypothetical protein
MHKDFINLKSQHIDLEERYEVLENISKKDKAEIDLQKSKMVKGKS